MEPIYVTIHATDMGDTALAITPALVDRTVATFMRLVDNATDLDTHAAALSVCTDLQILSLEMAAGTQETALTPLALAAIEAELIAEGVMQLTDAA